MHGAFDSLLSRSVREAVKLAEWRRVLVHNAADNREDYWNGFYASREAKKLSIPSQFAAFVAQEAVGDGLIIEIGCGNGRDSFFFAKQGFEVVAIDGSSAAIEKCSSLRDEQALLHLSFACSSVGTPEFLGALQEARAKTDGAATAYARFFLHAITDSEEEALLTDVSKALRPGDRLALEYRTVRDAAGEKVTAAHYRRFVDPTDVFVSATKLGFSVDYAVEGFGFAKYGADDAYAARCILRKN